MIAADRILRFGMWVGVSVIGMGCIQPEEPTSMNMPPSGDWQRQSELSEYFAYHNDQGMIADRSLSDIHFVPHSVQLSGTGEVRLARYAELLSEEGGTLNYQTAVCDEELIEARLAVARSYLAKACQTGKEINVVLGLPGGRGMSASEATDGQAVAKQPEPRGTAYKLSGAGGSASSNGG